MKKAGNLIAVAVLIGAFAFGGSWPRIASAQGPETFAIRNARIVPVKGAVIENGTVVISNGKITSVGANVAVPSGAKVINATGMSVYPGMIDSGTTLGLVEISSVAGTVDTAETGDNNANIHVDVAIQPDSSHVAVTRVNGITTVLTARQNGSYKGFGYFHFYWQQAENPTLLASLKLPGEPRGVVVDLVPRRPDGAEETIRPKDIILKIDGFNLDRFRPPPVSPRPVFC